MDIDDLETPQAALMIDVVRAFSRAIRAMGYYDVGHPVFESTRKEAHDALLRAFDLEDSVTLGSGGRHLIVDAESPALQDPPSRAIAERMFERAVVAIRIDPSVDEQGLALLMRALAESEDRIRHTGGVGAWLEKSDVRGITIIEVDFGRLFASETADLAPLVGDDPVARRALEEVLRFERSGGAVGNALAVSMEKLSTVESLGSFLDDLLDSGEAGVVKGADGAGGAFGVITGDDIADYAAQAYLKNQTALRGRSNPNEIGQSADLLADALVRLSPDARFALLRRLAGSDDPSSPEQEAAVQELAGRLDDRMIISTVAAALMERSEEADSVRAIGNVLRRLRPVEAERRRLLDAVDGTLAGRGRRVDGMLWQELQSRAFDDRTLGMLELAISESKEELARYAIARMRGQLPDFEGHGVLHARGAAVEENWSTRTLIEMLREPDDPSDAFISRCLEMLDVLDGAGALNGCLGLLEAMMRRADHDDTDRLRTEVRRVLEDDRGRKWSMRLLERHGGQSLMMGELLLSALDGAPNRATQTVLIERLGRFEGAVLYQLLSSRIQSVDPLRVQQMLRAALLCSPAIAVKLARIVLKGGAIRSKEVAMKTLVESTDRDVVALLAHIAGWKGEKYTIQLLGLSGDERRFENQLQLVAVGALGLTHSPLAVRPLVDLLATTQLIESKAHEELRLGAAHALKTNGTSQAIAALEELRSHKKRAVREICERVLMGRPNRAT